jgi:Na+/melibiose symporter-like transporter
VVAAGILASGLGWPGLLGRLPFGLLFKNQLGASPQQVASFWAIATVAWYLKPLVALACDSYPLFGTRRRGHLLVGAVLGSLGWMAFAVVPRALVPFLVVMVVLNLGLVMVSAATGGLLVEVGQRHHATGRLSALRTSLEGVMALVTGPLGGALATAAFVYTAATGAAVVAALIPVVWWLDRGPDRPGARLAPGAAARKQIATLIRSRPAWAAALLLFLVFLSPGLQTPLLYYQQDVLGLSARMMGILQMAGGVGALAGSAAYAWACRRLPLRWSLPGGIGLGAVSALLYLGYRSAGSALAIDALSGFLGALATLPLYDLAARATPRGTESLAYALLMAVRTVAVTGISDPLGAWLYGRWHLHLGQLAWVNAGATLAVLPLIAWLPRELLAAPESGPAGGQQAGRQDL